MFLKISSRSEQDDLKILRSLVQLAKENIISHILDLYNAAITPSFRPYARFWIKFPFETSASGDSKMFLINFMTCFKGS